VVVVVVLPSRLTILLLLAVVAVLGLLEAILEQVAAALVVI
jgi:hypothetical protein